MLEADEFDDDYFTPITNTPLSNIFHGSANKESTNESLKYTPPKKPAPVVESKPEEDSKVTECVLACAVTAYEWSKNSYTPQGKLGFALIKTIKNNIHNIILYNASKTTISSTTVTSILKITLKGNDYISFYDNTSKYWSLHIEDEKIRRITEILRNLNVEVKQATNGDEMPPKVEPSTLEKEPERAVLNKNFDKESDTDSSVSKKTKASILSRMANVGQSVLPTNCNIDKSTDCSDTSEKVEKPKIAKHKPKISAKKTNVEKNKLEFCQPVQSPVTAIATIEPPEASSSSTMYTFLNGQLVPVINSSIAHFGHSSNTDMSLFTTEQRVLNNEIRININRNTDKLDQVLEKINNLRTDERTNTSFQTEIMQKLIIEYENKIKMYEKILASQSFNISSIPPQSEQSDEIMDNKSKIIELQNTIEEKDKEIKRLKEESNSSNLIKEIIDLKQSLMVKTEELYNLSRKVQESAKLKDSDNIKEFENKLKYAMNEAFQMISINFKNDENYSGEHIKTVIASIIKKVTVQSITNYNKEV